VIRTGLSVALLDTVVVDEKTERRLQYLCSLKFVDFRIAKLIVRKQSPRTRAFPLLMQLERKAGHKNYLTGSSRVCNIVCVRANSLICLPKNGLPVFIAL
jgi:hypothetical protein